MRRQRSLRALGVILVVVAGMGMAAPASAQDVVKLAIVAEITGGGAPSGNMWRDGVILAVEDLNRKGGIMGRRVEHFVMDTQTDPPTSVAVIRRAINAGKSKRVHARVRGPFFVGQKAGEMRTRPTAVSNDLPHVHPYSGRKAQDVAAPAAASPTPLAADAE